VTPGRPENSAFPTTETGCVSVFAGKNNRIHYLRKEEAGKCHVDQDTFIKRFAKNTANEAIPIQVVRYEKQNFSGYLPDIRVDTAHSVAYLCGLGYNSLFAVASHNPRSVSKTSLQSEVRNSLNTPPPSMPALIEDQDKTSKPKVTMKLTLPAQIGR
jgi:hypothetical protein